MRTALPPVGTLTVDLFVETTGERLRKVRVLSSRQLTLTQAREMAVDLGKANPCLVGQGLHATWMPDPEHFEVAPYDTGYAIRQAVSAAVQPRVKGDDDQLVWTASN